MASKNTMSDRNLVSKGTSSDDTPTPGFVLKELVSRISLGTSKFQTLPLVSLLVPRLKKSDPNIKLKALKIINVCCSPCVATVVSYHKRPCRFPERNECSPPAH